MARSTALVSESCYYCWDWRPQVDDSGASQEDQLDDFVPVVNNDCIHNMENENWKKQLLESLPN